MSLSRAEEASVFDKNGSLSQYIAEVHTIPLLSAEEEIKLAKKIESGDKEAKGKLAQANLRLVIKCAQQNCCKGLDFSDLIQEGNIGLLKAVEKFDWREKCKFSTYAVPWINQAITRAMDNKSRIIRIPSYKNLECRKYIFAKEKLMSEIGREPTAQEIASSMNVGIKEVEELERTLSLKTLSMETSIDGEEGSDSRKLIDFLPDRIENLEIGETSPEEEASNNLLKEKISQLLTILTPREEEVIKMRFGLTPYGRSYVLGEIGKKFGVSRERIRQIETKALRKIRFYSLKNNYCLTEYL